MWDMPPTNETKPVFSLTILTLSFALVLLINCVGCINFKERPCPLEHLSDAVGLYGAWKVIALADDDQSMNIIHVGPSGDKSDPKKKKDISPNTAGQLTMIFVGPIDKKEPLGMIPCEAGAFEVNGTNYFQYRILYPETSKKSKTKTNNFGLCRFRYDSESKDKLHIWMPSEKRITASTKKGRLKSTDHENSLVEWIVVDNENSNIRNALAEYGPGLIFDKEPTHELRRITRK